MKKTELKDLNVNFISLVGKGANGKDIIYKSKDDNFSKNIPIAKHDEEKGIVVGIVYSPNELDTDNEFASKETIEKACYSFMKNKHLSNVDKDHSFKNEDAYVCESWIIKKGDPTFPDEKEGSWAVAIKIEDEKLKKAVKSGEIGGISMAGVCIKEVLPKLQMLELSIQNELTNRHKIDMASSSKLTQMIRPASLVYWSFIYTILGVFNKWIEAPEYFVEGVCLEYLVGTLDLEP